MLAKVGVMGDAVEAEVVGDVGATVAKGGGDGAGGVAVGGEQSEAAHEAGGGAGEFARLEVREVAFGGGRDRGEEVDGRVRDSGSRVMGG